MKKKRYELIETAVLRKPLDYDGSQLRSHFVREKGKIAGDGVVAFTGGCSVSGGMLVDLEDAEAGHFIAACRMVHFIGEHFQCPLREANFRLRLFVSIIGETIERMAPGAAIERRGDDLFTRGRKLTVAIVTAGPLSSVFHCGVNIDPDGAPVPAIGLGELGIDEDMFMREVLERYSNECASVETALRKVRSV